jgi:hypothetical protein
MVRIGDARGVVQVREAKTVACIVSGTQVSCGGS